MIEKDVQVFLPMYSLHYHSDYFEEPKVFKPERFAEAGSIKRFTEAGVLGAFGSGPRQCLGMKFATPQVKAAICAIIKNFEVTPKEQPDNVSKQASYMFFSDNFTSVEFKKIQSK